MEFSVRTADEQMRTIRDVPREWVRPKPPSKRAGRHGTRRAWKRRNPPHQTYGYREPTDIIVLAGSARMLATSFRYVAPAPDLYIVTPAQMAAFDHELQKRNMRR